VAHREGSITISSDRRKRCDLRALPVGKATHTNASHKGSVVAESPLYRISYRYHTFRRHVTMSLLPQVTILATQRPNLWLNTRGIRCHNHIQQINRKRKQATMMFGRYTATVAVVYSLLATAALAENIMPSRRLGSLQKTRGHHENLTIQHKRQHQPSPKKHHGSFDVDPNMEVYPGVVLPDNSGNAVQDTESHASIHSKSSKRGHQVSDYEYVSGSSSMKHLKASKKDGKGKGKGGRGSKSTKGNKRGKRAKGSKKGKDVDYPTAAPGKIILFFTQDFV